MSHYPFLDPAVKQRARAAGLDIERSTDEFLRTIRRGRNMRPDVLTLLEALLTGPPLSMVAATDDWYRRESKREAA